MLVKFNKKNYFVQGRTHTVELKCSEDNQKAKWDLGGQWVTDTQENITRILNELKLETYTQFDSGRKVLETCGKVVSYTSSIPNVSLFSLFDLQLMLNKINNNAKKVNTLRPFENLQFARYMDSMNLEQWLFSSSFSATSRSIVEAASRTLFGLEMNQVNALYANNFVKSAGSFEALTLCEAGCAQEKKIKGGAQQISEKLLANVLENNANKIVFNGEIVEIQQDDIIQVRVKDTSTNQMTTFKAKKVVSAIPINLIQKIAFTPDLPMYKWNVLRSCRIGNYGKFVITYKTAFWREKGFSGEVVSDGSTVLLKSNGEKEIPKYGPISCLFDGSDFEDRPALIGFISADSLVQWSGRNFCLILFIF